MDSPRTVLTAPRTGGELSKLSELACSLERAIIWQGRLVFQVCREVHLKFALRETVGYRSPHHGTAISGIVHVGAV